MVAPPDAASESLRDARERYFQANGFGDGGYSARWVELKVGPIPVYLPNSPGRVRAVRYHDLHHVLTGFGTDWVGEAEIGAWELASGCRDHWAAWVLNAGAVGLGLLLAPRRVLAAWRWGRATRNLYGEVYDDALLSESVADARGRLGLGAAPRRLFEPAASDVSARDLAP